MKPEDAKVDEFFAVVIGTGFGGAVTACRLTQALSSLPEDKKGRRICVLERGRRYSSADFPELPKAPFALPDQHRWFWESDQGLFDARHLGGVGVLQAAGYGGGSLIYANVHLRAPPDAFDKWPDGITRQVLEPYYDLVAAMLDIQPVTDNPGQPDDVPLKARVLEQAAAGLKVSTFRPPLAVSFDAGTNAFGRNKQACKSCGSCCFGCPHDAKNTLDRNYLAEVEKFPDIAEIRTLCEVVAISECEQGAYEILYRDFTRRERLFRSDAERLACTGPEYARIRAGNVFVCGGAINSTQLLMRSRQAHEIWEESDPGSRGGLPLGLRADKLSAELGKGYFPNADAIATVFDTKEPVKPSVGPTITTAAVFKHDDQQFMVEDGAYPEETKHFFDMVFRSGLLMDSNRFRTNGCRSEKNKCDEFNWPVPTHAEPSRFGRPPHFLEGIVTAVGEGAFDSILSAGFTTALSPRWEFYKTAFNNREEIGLIIQAVKRSLPRDQVVRVLRKLPRYMRNKATIWFLKATFEGFANGLYRWAKDERIFVMVRRGLNRWFHIGSASRFIRQGNRLLLDQLSGRRGPVRPGIPPGTRLPKISEGVTKDPWDHRMLLLVMGRDDRPFTMIGRESVDRFFDELGIVIQPPASTASVPTRHGPRGRTNAQIRQMILRSLGPKAQRACARREAWRETIYTAEESFLRDIAREVEGELRTNPLYTLGEVPVSTHSQGGCAMTDTPDGVTDSYGQVRNFPRLFVNDGALMPTSIGVNPSSTIAALAERNIEHFIRHEIDDRWTAPEVATLVPRWRQKAAAGSWVLTPPVVPDTHTNAKPIGIEFREKMQGFFIWKKPGKPLPNARDAESFFRAEAQGRERGTRLSFQVDARVRDAQAFMHNPAREIEFFGGSLQIESMEAKVVRGYMHLLVEDGPLLHSRTVGRRRMDYKIRARASGGVTYTLVGHKFLRNDPGLDSWADTSILFCKIRKRSAPEGVRKIEKGYGVVRVTLNEFLYEAVPSFKVINSGGDEAREAQALSKFLFYFIGGLQNVYIPHLTDARFFSRKRGAS